MSKKYFIAILLVLFVIIITLSFRTPGNESYRQLYQSRINEFSQSQTELLKQISTENINTAEGKAAIKNKIEKARLKMKAVDFWFRYLDPVTYHKINGPLPVEWETEVFEKFEPPYKREGAGLTLAGLYMDEEQNPGKDSLTYLVKSSLQATNIYMADSITVNLKQYHHFYLANRLFLLNLAAIYTTGFECPDRTNIIPELGSMLESVTEIYSDYDKSFADHAIKKEYLNLYRQTITFVNNQSKDPDKFDHYNFIKNYVNPLFSLNQKMIREYQVVSNNFNDFSLTDNSVSIFDKALYKGQNEKGVYIAVDDEATLEEIKQVGKLLFYDPILSGNNMRSCASCHKPTEYFTDTAAATSPQFDVRQVLPRNTPSLINVVYNHLLMQDGKHISLLAQAKDVIDNPVEMGGEEKEIVKKVMSCPDYENAFKRFVKLTPNSKKININHITSAVILYYSSFSNYYAPFDDAMNDNKPITLDCEKGFNVFMSKAKCATCHYPPQFSGVRPPYIGSEFEVLGVPADTAFSSLSKDSGRALINPAPQTMHAFRTGNIRNATFTKPYMHNGVFNTLDEVISFYDAGGGKGKGLQISNQTLSADSLKLSAAEKDQLMAFIRSLTEDIPFENPPAALPVSKDKKLNYRKVGGEY